MALPRPDSAKTKDQEDDLPIEGRNPCHWLSPLQNDDPDNDADFDAVIDTEGGLDVTPVAIYFIYFSDSIFFEELSVVVEDVLLVKVAWSLLSCPGQRRQKNRWPRLRLQMPWRLCFLHVLL